jgi:hypothetical protein
MRREEHRPHNTAEKSFARRALAHVRGDGDHESSNAYGDGREAAAEPFAKPI